MKIISEFDLGATDPFPSHGCILLKDVNLKTTANHDIRLPRNHRLLVQGIDVVSKSVSSLSAGATITVTERSGSSTVQTLLAATQLSASSVAETLENVFERGLAPDITIPSYVYLQNVIAAGTTGLVTQVTDLSAAGSASVAAQPDVPRNVVLTLSDAADANLAGSVIVTGKNVFGTTISETFTVVAGTTSYTGNLAFAKITSVAHDFGETGTSSDTLDLGQGAKLGLPYPDLAITKLVSNGTEESASATSASNGTFTPTTAPNGTNDYEVWFSYTEDQNEVSQSKAVSGADVLRVAISAATATAQTADIVIRLVKF